MDMQSCKVATAFKINDSLGMCSYYDHLVNQLASSSRNLEKIEEAYFIFSCLQCGICHCFSACST